MTFKTSVGPVGTGVHLLRGTRSRSGQLVADVWITLLHFPLLPLGRWTFACDEQGAPNGVSEIARPRPVRAAATIALAALGLAGAVAPGVLAITWFMGDTKLELAGVLGSASLLLLLLGWLDETRPRVSIDTVRRALRPSRP